MANVQGKVKRLTSNDEGKTMRNLAGSGDPAYRKSVGFGKQESFKVSGRCLLSKHPNADCQDLILFDYFNMLGTLGKHKIKVRRHSMPQCIKFGHGGN